MLTLFKNQRKSSIMLVTILITILFNSSFHTFASSDLSIYESAYGYSNTIINEQKTFENNQGSKVPIPHYAKGSNWLLSGFEPEYNPSIWNDEGQIQYSTNCYAYAANLMYNPKTGNNFLTLQQAKNQKAIDFGLQPGMLSEQSLNMDFSNIKLVCEADAKTAGRTFRQVGRDELCPKGTYKVALYTATVKASNGNTVGIDYHWYRQNPDGTWSHKPGSTKVTNLDFSGKIISDPQTADRSFSGIPSQTYNNFIGYFAMGSFNYWRG